MSTEIPSENTKEPKISSVQTTQEVSISLDNTPVKILADVVASSEQIQPKPSQNRGNKTRQKTVEIRSLEQLLREVYETSKVRSNIRKVELLAIKNTVSGIDNVREELLELAKKDRTLELTRLLIVLNTKIEGVKSITDFIRDVLRQHPAFQSPDILTFFSNPSESADSILRNIASQTYTSLKWPVEFQPLTKSQASKCKSNAVFCFIFYVWLSGDRSFVTLLNRLRNYSWEQRTENKSDLQKVTILAQTRELAATSVIFDLFKEEADSLKIDKNNAVSRAEKAEKDLRESRSTVELLQADINDLTNRLQALERKFEIHKVNAIDAYEKLCGRIRGKLRAEIQLLDDGLHALRRDPPLVPVMIDHAERAIGGLRDELAQLEEDN